MCRRDSMMTVNESIFYRKATIEDCDALTKIRMDNMEKYMNIESDEDRDALRKSIKRHFENTIADGSLITWLACDGDKIIATGGLTFFTVTPSMTNITGKQGYITNMYTYPEYRCRGIGRKLLELTVTDAIAYGCGRIVLYKTGMGENIYKNFGFEDSSGYMTYCPPIRGLSG